MKALPRLLLGLAAFASASGLAALPAAALDKVVLRINFSPWAMHAQYYAAIAQGYYAKEGIELEIRPVSAGQSVEALVASGREHFGLDNADSFVQAKASGMPIVAILADQPDAPTAVITLASSGIAKANQLKGKKISWFQANVKSKLDPLLKSAGLSRDDIEYVMVTRGAEVQMLAAGKVDAIWGYAFGQALTLESKGFPVNVLAMKDNGLVNYGTVIFTTEALIKSDPDLVRRFVKATLQGYIWTQKNQEAAVAEVIKVAPDRDQKLETKKLGIIFALYNSPDYVERFGKMSDAKWAATIDSLAEDLPSKPSPSSMYTNQFVDSIDEAKTLSQAVRAPTN
ncbi:ABC transporter substrate-binding protein [Aquabacter spiritensis]|uniref:NitT/TauT family transport system substrate-binding protein n=1 Tax=Aquabacter spiritensis TaxID=933073 RepID=A0A4R3LK98_9HYPH|nr:ABC transporter substrate-binding protein [Aquabacter spiritensis]TCT00604.1 NitT/TauT family transport system substrate-binding protein [Aquabacter spiritensis]